MVEFNGKAAREVYNEIQMLARIAKDTRNTQVLIDKIPIMDEVQLKGFVTPLRLDCSYMDAEGGFLNFSFNSVCYSHSGVGVSFSNEISMELFENGVLVEKQSLCFDDKTGHCVSVRSEE